MFWSWVFFFVWVKFPFWSLYPVPFPVAEQEERIQWLACEFGTNGWQQSGQRVFGLWLPSSNVLQTKPVAENKAPPGTSVC